MLTGIAEGPEEIPVGACFPLEYNLDFCHGGGWLNEWTILNDLFST